MTYAPKSTVNQIAAAFSVSDVEASEIHDALIWRFESPASIDPLTRLELEANECVRIVTDDWPSPDLPPDRDYFDARALCLAARAVDAFDQGYDGGRIGMRAALKAAIQTLAATPGCSDAMLRPLWALFNAISDLDRGALHPALVSAPIGSGRREYHSVQRSLQLACVFAVDVLERSGMPASKARQSVAKRAEEAAKRVGLSGQTSHRGGKRSISADAIRAWIERDFPKWRAENNELSIDYGRRMFHLDEMRRAGAPVEIIREAALGLLDADHFAHLSSDL